MHAHLIAVKLLDRHGLQRHRPVVADDPDLRAVARLVNGSERHEEARVALRCHASHMDARRHAELHALRRVRNGNAHLVRARGAVGHRRDLTHRAGSLALQRPEIDGDRLADRHVRQMILGHIDFDLELARLHERRDGLSRCDDLAFLRRDGRNHAVRAGRQVRIAERVVALRSLGERILIGRERGVILRLILVEHGGRDGLLIVELAVTREVRLREIQLRARRCDGRVALVRLLHDILRVDDHERITRAHAVADVHVARENLPADLEREVRLIPPAHRAGVRVGLCARIRADDHRPHERRLRLDRRVLAAACGSRHRAHQCNDKKGTQALHALLVLFSIFKLCQHPVPTPSSSSPRAP